MYDEYDEDIYLEDEFYLDDYEDYDEYDEDLYPEYADYLDTDQWDYYNGGEDF